jgi:N4-gp56 family major capsid protein
MRSIQELTASAITDTSTVSAANSTAITNFRMTQYAKDIVKVGEDFRFMQNLVDHNTELVGSRDHSVRIFFAESHLDFSTTTTKTEGNERTYTELTNLSYVDAVPTYKFYAVAISKQIVDNARVDLVDLAKYMIAEDTEKEIEEAIITELETATTNVVYGGDATSVATLETGDVLTPSVVADAIELLESNNYKPKFLAISPKQKAAFNKDSQFVNASEYGGREVILNGEYGTYLNVKIITTTNVNQKTNATHSWGVTGHWCHLLAQNQFKQNAATLVWKEKPNYDYEYLKRYTNHYIYSDAAYDAELVLEPAVCAIKVSDA